MAQQAEEAFAKTFLNTLATQPVIYADDYQQPPENSLKRVPVLQVEVPPAPTSKVGESSAGSTSSSAQVTLTIKSSKPPFSVTLPPLHLTDTIGSLKSLLASQPGAPPSEAQRLLLKGKALSADAKLLREYDLKDGDTINLMVKPGIQWDPNSTSSSSSTTPTNNNNKAEDLKIETPVPQVTLSQPTPMTPSAPSLVSGKPKQSHTRIPSVVLSPSPSNDNPTQDITLTLDPTPPSVPVETYSSYHATVVKPEFWEKLHLFLKQETPSNEDALHLFEDFLRASKGALTANDIAKIRDTVGVVGMAGR